MRRVFRIPFGRAPIEREVDDELAFHLETRTRQLIAAGWEPAAARDEALRQFGDIESVRRDCQTIDQERERTMYRTHIIDELRQNTMYGLRTLRRNPGFTAIIVGALALGIGANTAIFTLIDAVVVRSLPVDHPEQLVVIGDPTKVSSGWQGSPRTDILSAPLYRDVSSQTRSFVGVLASGGSGRLDARIDGNSEEFEHPRGRFVSANYFSLLGVRAFAGRTFDSVADRVPGAAPLVVISDSYWTRRFSRDPSAIGRAILINGIRMTIDGVAPPSFTGEVVGQAPDIWLPMSMEDVLRPNLKMLNDRSQSWLLLLGRLKPGVTVAQARNEVTAVMKRSILATATGRDAKDFAEATMKYYVSPGGKGFSRVRDTFTTPLFTLMIGVALLLCIICANVANLLLARAISRGREMALRLSLGADRARLIRQLLTESAMLALLSAGVGLVVAWAGGRGLIAMASDGAPLSLTLGLDGAVLAFTLVVSILCVTLFGVVPAVRASRVDLATAMRGGASSISGALGARGGRVPLGRVLIAAQVALSVVLLVAAGMLVRSLRNVEGVDVGLDRDHLVIVDLDIVSRGYQGAQLANVLHAIRDRLEAVPGVRAVTFSENGLFSGTESGANVTVPGFVTRAPHDDNIAYDVVGPGYVEGIGGRLIAGREISANDEASLPRQAMVNESLAAYYFGGQNAIGRYLNVDTVAVQIIGVLADTRDHNLQGTLARRAYFSYVHADDPKNLGAPGSLRFEVRTKGDPSGVVNQLRQVVVSVDPSLPINGVNPLTTLMRQSIREERLVTQLATAFGVLALLLAAIGLYGVMTYAMARRTGEIGLRVALGAQRVNVMRMVLADGLRLVAVGLVIGLPLAIASARLLRSQLHGVPSADMVSIGAAIVVLAASAVVAVIIPAARASGVSAVVALKAD